MLARRVMAAGCLEVVLVVSVNGVCTSSSTLRSETAPRRPSCPSASRCGTRASQSLAASSRDSAASCIGLPVPVHLRGASESMIVPKIDSVPSRLSTSSTILDCSGKSMCEAVLISQKPPRPASPRGAGAR